MSGLDLNAVRAELERHGDGIPPVDRWQPEACGNIDMRIARDGTWYYNGSPIGRPAMVRLFSHVLWQEDGRYFLKTPAEKVGIQVDDLPFLFLALERHEGPEGVELHFYTQTGDRVVAGPEHDLRVEIQQETGEPAPSLDVRFGMRGRIHRNLFYELVEMAVVEPAADGGQELVLYSHGTRFSLGQLD